MFTVRDLLRLKGSQVWATTSDKSILETLQLMADKDVGALLVMDGDKIAGIVSERDFVRSIARNEICSLNTPVVEYMTEKVITVSPGQTLVECLDVMTKNKIRHLPVLDGGKLVGLISIGDVVKELISDSEQMVQQLQSYIEGGGYGH